MTRAALLLAAVAPLALAACNSRPAMPVPEASQGPQTPPKPRHTPTPFPVPSPPKPAAITPDELAGLTSRDCETVANAYFSAVQRSAWDYAARFWADPVIDGPRVAALFNGYVSPNVIIDDVQEEGAAGSLYCTRHRRADGTPPIPARECAWASWCCAAPTTCPAPPSSSCAGRSSRTPSSEKLERSGNGSPA